MKFNINYRLFIATLVVTVTVTACNRDKKQATMTTLNDSSIFPKGDKLTNGYFTGDAFLYPLLAKDANNEFALGSVTFEPGARTLWHTHPKGQVLLITDGNGIYQEKGQAAQHLKKGTVVNIPANVEHWHGASSADHMVHIAITNYKEEVNVVWLTPVSDEEYSQANKSKNQ